MTADSGGVATDDRRAELAANLTDVRRRIEVAARTAGRPAADLTLIAVSKTFPATDVLALLDLGVRDFGENRDREAAAKVASVAVTLAAGAGGSEPLPRWHFVGQVQRKKAGSVASYADVVHSLDRAVLADALGRAVQARAEGGRTSLDVLVQVNLDSDSDSDSDGVRGGIGPADVVRLAEHVLTVPGLRLAGVMGLAPPTGDPATAFAVLAGAAAQVRSVSPEARLVSAGMSGDLEAAVLHGATHVRVGTALFGGRAIKSEDGRIDPRRSTDAVP